MENINLQKAAQALRSARSERRTIPRISETFGIHDIDSAYVIGNLNTDDALMHGRRISGKKIGLTSQAVQQQLGVDQPDFGVLFADMEYLTGDEVSSKRLVQPKAEGEVAFVVGRDLEDDAMTWSRFLLGIEYALPAIEIVDSVIDDWKITLVDTVADNASCGVYVLGTTPRRVSDLTLPECKMQFLKNDQAVSEGSGAACLGNPLYAAWWLAKTLVKFGQPLRAGDVVLSGALGPMITCFQGDRLEVQISGLGRVACRIG